MSWVLSKTRSIPNSSIDVRTYWAGPEEPRTSALASAAMCFETRQEAEDMAHMLRLDGFSPELIGGLAPRSATRRPAPGTVAPRSAA